MASVLGLLGGIALAAQPRAAWSEAEIEKLRTLWIGSLPPVPADPSNRVADDPRAAALGKQLFFEARLSANGQVACATCHQPDKFFQDGRPVSQGLGRGNRRTPTLVGAGYVPWLFWDGRKDSLWAQALSPLENPIEHGADRFQLAQVIARYYGAEYEVLFGPLSMAEPGAVTRVFVNIGKAIAAYERTLLPRPGLFDRYVAAVLTGDDDEARSILTPGQVAGLQLFIGQAGCTRCHNTPLFTDHKFHNTGVPPADGRPPDSGWVDGLPQMLEDEFGCKGSYSDVEPGAPAWSDTARELDVPAGPFGCRDRRYLVVGLANQVGAFKTPTLRHIASRAPYMHAGQFATLAEVLRHYAAAPPAGVGESELRPLNLTAAELADLNAFLKTLDELPDPVRER